MRGNSVKLLIWPRVSGQHNRTVCLPVYVCMYVYCYCIVFNKRTPLRERARDSFLFFFSPVSLLLSTRRRRFDVVFSTVRFVRSFVDLDHIAGGILRVRLLFCCFFARARRAFYF